MYQEISPAVLPHTTGHIFFELGTTLGVRSRSLGCDLLVLSVSGSHAYQAHIDSKNPDVGDNGQPSPASFFGNPTGFYAVRSEKSGWVVVATRGCGSTTFRYVFPGGIVKISRYSSTKRPCGIDASSGNRRRLSRRHTFGRELTTCLARGTYHMRVEHEEFVFHITVSTSGHGDVAVEQTPVCRTCIQEGDAAHGRTIIDLSSIDLYSKEIFVITSPRTSGLFGQEVPY